MKPIGIIDLDGVLFTVPDVARLAYFNKLQSLGYENAFREYAESDPMEHCFHPVNPEVLEVLKWAQKSDYRIMLATARPRLWFNETCSHLKACRVDFDYLYMRKKNDFRVDVEVKQDFIEHVRKHDIQRYGACNFGFALEDSPSVCALYRSMGIFTVHINSGLTS